MGTSVFCENTSGFQLKKAKKQPRQLQLCLLCNHQRKGLKSRNYHAKELLSSSNNIFTMQYSTGLLNCHRESKLPLSDHKLGGQIQITDIGPFNNNQCDFFLIS